MPDLRGTRTRDHSAAITWPSFSRLANHRPHRLPKRRQSAAHCSTDNVAECVKLFYQAGDISHQPPTPRPNTHTANPFATSRSGLRYRWKPHFQGIVMTGNLLLQNALPFGFKLGPFRDPRVHFEAKGAKRDKTQFGVSFLLTSYYDSKENTSQHTRTNTSDIFRFKCTFGPRNGPKEAKTAE